MGEFKPGDWNQSKTKRFWKYHKPSLNGEWWLSPEKFEEYRIKSKIDNAQRRNKNPEACRIAVKNWKSNNLEKAKNIWKNWANKNPEKIFNYKSIRRQRENSKTLSEIEILIVKTIINCRKRISKCTGIKFHVDHIVPLSRGGKHEPCNLQILPAIINQRKHAKLQATT